MSNGKELDIKGDIKPQRRGKIIELFTVVDGGGKTIVYTRLLRGSSREDGAGDDFGDNHLGVQTLADPIDKPPEL